LRRTQPQVGAGALSAARRRLGGRQWVVGLGWVFMVAVAFLLGYLLAAHDARQSSARIQALQTERDLLTEALAAQRDAEAKLKRSHQMDVEAQRAAQAQITALEAARAGLERRFGHLQALLAATGRGVVDVEGLELSPVGDGLFEYRVTVSQLAPAVEQTEGELVLSLVSRQDGSLETTPLGRLSDSGAGRHAMSFERIGVFAGRFSPVGVGEPLQIVVEIASTDDNLLSSKSVFPWAAALSTQDRPDPLGAATRQSRLDGLAPTPAGRGQTEAASESESESER
jgi:hypothetical protein